MHGIFWSSNGPCALASEAWSGIVYRQWLRTTFSLIFTFVLGHRFSGVDSNKRNARHRRWTLCLYRHGVTRNTGEFALLPYNLSATHSFSVQIKIYRCWVMWRQPWIVFAPAIITLACLGTTNFITKKNIEPHLELTFFVPLGTLLACLVVQIKTAGFNPSAITVFPSWYGPAVVAFFSLSLAANAVATGLIVFKIFMVYRELQTVKNRAGFANGRGSFDRYPILSILVESGLVTFVGQLVQTVLFKNDNAMFPIVSGIVVMLYVRASCSNPNSVVLIILYAGNFTNHRPCACCDGHLL